MVLGLWSRVLNLRLIDAIGCRLLSSMLPKGNRLPTSRDKARRYVTSRGGLDYDRIHACMNNPIYHARIKHIEVHYHFVREKVLAREVDLVYVSTEK